MSEIRLELFGGLRATVDGRPAPRFRTHRSALIAITLALTPGRRHAREAIAERLWPDEDPTLQRNRLRYELSQLRATLGPDFLAPEDRQTLALAPEVRSDVHDFRDALLESVRERDPETRLRNLERAARLAHDDLLPEFFDEWILTEREQWRDARFDVLSRLLLDLERLGRADDAAQVRRTVAAHFPERPLPPTAFTPTPGAPAGTPLFGRESDLETLRQRLARHRLVTLTGPGGVGKTRLAREVARTADHRFVPFEQCGDVESFWDTLADALEDTDTPQRGLPPRARALRALRTPNPPLLILDNLEQIVPAVAAPLEELLDACPEITCLATSQRPLRIPPEHEIPLAPLSDSAAKALFLHHARLARPDFATLERGVAAVRETVQMLDGLPLAIELAAARAVVLGPAQIRDQLQERLDFLVRIRPGAAPRHRGIRAALEWSVGLLAPSRRGALGALAVFRDGFPLDAARAVCGDHPPILDTLEDLHLQSLLQVAFDREDESARYTLPGLVRAFADEIGDASDRRAVRARHAAYFAAALRDAGDRRAHLLRRERANLLHALDHALETDDAPALFVFFDHAASAWFESGLRDRFVRLLDALEPRLQTESASPNLARLLGLRGADARRQGDEAAARACWQRRLEVFRKLEDTAGVVNTLLELAGQACDAGETADGARWLAQAQEAIEAGGLEPYRLNARVMEARLAARAGDRPRALQAVATARAEMARGDASDAALTYAHTYLAVVLRTADGGAEAEAALRAAIGFAQDHDQLFATGLLALEMARLHRDRNEVVPAQRAYRVAAGIHADLQSRLARVAADEERAFRQTPPSPQDPSWRELLPELR